ncbi:MAG: lipid-A-disaccharide synthase, partial [Pedosphaera sp.]|nr:lipid-A-disaccharide synthase [Pedosphaera sp.]
FVGHPLIDRYARTPFKKTSSRPRRLLLLPGSRPGELRRHWPVMAAAAEEVRRATGSLPVLVLPTESSRAWLPESVTPPLGLEIHIGNLAQELSRTDVAIASTGTVTLECAWFTVPTVALYRTSWSTYQIGRQIINVPYLALPNILANKAVIPEFIQDAATPSAIAEAVIQLLNDPVLHSRTVAELERVRELLGDPGVCRRAADAILELSRTSDL